MFSQVFDKINDLLEKRFVLTYFLPSSLLIAGVVLVGWLATHHALSELGKLWSDVGVPGQLYASIVFVGVATLLALLYESNSVLVIQLFEGYLGPAKWLSKVGVAHHRRLHADMGQERQHFLYPDASEIMPTKLGNILKSAEVYPRILYGIDAVIVWPRLFRLLPTELLADLGTARQKLELPLMTCFSSAVIAVGGALILPVMERVELGFYAITVGAASLIALLAYETANGSALAYAELIKSTFDLYRHTLLKELGLGIPSSDADERLLWERIANSWYRSGPMPRQ